MQILDTLFGQKRGRRGARCRRERGGVWGGWDGLCCQLPPKMWFSSNNYHYLFPSLTIWDESVMMTSVSFAHSWSSEDFFSQFTPNHHWVSALELFRYSAEEEAIYKRAPCVCSLWSAVCVNTEASAHTGVWTVREVDFFFVDRFGLSACFLSARTNLECMQGKDGCTDQVQFFRKEHPGFAWAGCGCSKAVFPDLLLLLFQLTLQLMDRLRAEPLHV